MGCSKQQRGPGQVPRLPRLLPEYVVDPLKGWQKAYRITSVIREDASLVDSVPTTLRSMRCRVRHPVATFSFGMNIGRDVFAYWHPSCLGTEASSFPNSTRVAVVENGTPESADESPARRDRHDRPGAVRGIAAVVIEGQLYFDGGRTSKQSCFSNCQLCTWAPPYSIRLQ